MATVKTFYADISSIYPSLFHSLSTQLLKQSYLVILYHWRSTTVSQETYPPLSGLYDWHWLELWCPEIRAVTKVAKIHLIVKWAELISLQSIWLKFVNFAEQILFRQICLKNWPKSSNPLTFTQFDKIWSNLPFLALCEFLNISEDWWNVSCSPQLKINLSLSYSWLDWIYYHFFFIFS